MKKKLLLLVLMMLPMVASADAVEIDGVYYKLYGNLAEVTSNPNKYKGSIIIPETVAYQDVSYRVTSIDNWSFSSCSGLTSITIPNSVRSIGDYAFSGCSGLTSVTIPNSVTTIKSHAFDGCKRLTTLVIPNSVTSIGSYAFAYCSGLTSVTIPNSMEYIPQYAFQDCTNITTITIPNSVTSIGDKAFDGCRLEELMIYNVNAKCPKAFTDRTLQHAMLYIPEGTWSDAIYVGDYYLFNNIREVAMNTQSLSPSITYNLINTESFGYAIYDETTNNIKMAKAFYSIDENDANNCWQIQSQSDKSYLYNLGAKKYASVNADGNITLSVYPVEITMTEGENGLILGTDTNHRWGFVKSQGQSNPTSINTNIHIDATDGIYYSLDGRQFKEPQKGINIVRYKDGTTKKVIINKVD